MKIIILLFLMFSLPGPGVFGQENSSEKWEGRTNSEASQFDPEQFDAYVQKAIKDWGVPGLAIAVVKEDSVLFNKGYGVREMGSNAAVNTETLFAVASTTKAFTAASVGMLVDEGKLNWDDKVTEHLPQFRLSDPYLTAQITVRDLLTHRAGLPNTDFLWLEPETKTGEMIQRLEHVEAAYSLRSGFVYQNVMYAVAGEVIEAVSGIPWAEFVEKRIFEPLQMERSVATFAESRSKRNVARPHDYVGDELEVIDDSRPDEIGPAGSMWSSAGDMSRWLRFLLRGCETETGERLLSESSCNEMFKPQVVLPEPMYPTAQLTNPHWNTYGLGWFQKDYEGRKVDFHTGSLSGTVALAGLIRDEGIGVFVLGNRDHAEIRHALMYRVFDLFDEDEPRDWSREVKELYDEREEKQTAARVKTDSTLTAERTRDASPGLPLESYEGSYKDPLYGTVEITKSGENLRLRYGAVEATLEHWHYNTFRARMDRQENTSRPLINFDINSSGRPQRLNFWDMEFEREETDK